jgi:hypothetical protein
VTTMPYWGPDVLGFPCTGVQMYGVPAGPPFSEWLARHPRSYNWDFGMSAGHTYHSFWYVSRTHLSLILVCQPDTPITHPAC